MAKYTSTIQRLGECHANVSTSCMCPMLIRLHGQESLQKKRKDRENKRLMLARGYTATKMHFLYIAFSNFKKNWLSPLFRMKVHFRGCIDVALMLSFIFLAKLEASHNGKSCYVLFNDTTLAFKIDDFFSHAFQIYLTSK